MTRKQSSRLQSVELPANWQREAILAHEFVPAVRAHLFKRAFTKAQRSDLARLGCDSGQVSRLEHILPAVALFTKPGPKLGDVRALLVKLEKHLDTAKSQLAATLDAPEHERARSDARWFLLQSLSALPPVRDGARGDEARNMLNVLSDLADSAKRACKSLPPSQTRSHAAMGFPVEMIEAALNVDGGKVTVSESPNSDFRRIVGICYAAAKTSNADPVKAIRALRKSLNIRNTDVREYLQRLNASSKN